MLERALAVLPPHEPQRRELLLRLSDTYLGLGDVARADPGSCQRHGEGSAAGQRTQDAAGQAGPVPDAVLEIQHQIVALRSAKSDRTRLLATVRESERQLAPADHLGWCRFYQLLALRHLADEQVGAAEASFAAALDHAVELESDYEADRIRRSAAELAMWGPAPVAEGLQRCRELSGVFSQSRVFLVPILAALGGLLGLDGRFAEAREAFATATEYAGELRMSGADIGLAHLQGVVESAAGEHRLAAGHFGRARQKLAEAGQPSGAALLARYQARALIAAGEPVPAEFADIAEPDPRDLSDKRVAALTCMLRAFGAVQAGVTRRAHDLARDALASCDLMEDVFFQGCMYQDAALVLQRCGLRSESREAAQTALERYRAKGARACVPAVEAQLAEMATT